MSEGNEKILYIGDNLPIMLGMESNSVDLIYTDPPFNTGTFRKGKTEKHSFIDTWTDYQVDFAYAYSLKAHYPKLWEMIILAEDMHSPAMRHYLEFMAPRIVQMHRLLKPTGTLYLHCDPNANYYLRLVMDCVFGKNNFLNEIVWAYRTGGVSKKYYPRKHDTLFFYAKGKSHTHHAPKETVLYDKPFFSGGEPDEGGKYPVEVYMRDVWEKGVKPVINTSKERTGYDSQKPLALLNRIIRASSNEGDLVMDPFCGCATTCVAAAGLSRRWIGIDQNEEAIQIFRDRLTGDLTTYYFETNMPVDAKLQKPIALPQREPTGYKKLSRAKAKIMLIQRDNKDGVTPYCRGCFDTPGEKYLEVDHILAQNKGGLDELENFQLLCGNCNRRKGNKDMEFLYEVLNTETRRRQRQILNSKKK